MRVNYRNLPEGEAESESTSEQTIGSSFLGGLAKVGVALYAAKKIGKGLKSDKGDDSAS